MSTTLLDALTALGSTPTQIVDSLLEQGIAGVQGSSTGCPVALYLNKVFPGSRFEVSTCAIYDANAADDDWLPGLGRDYEIETPQAVEMFISAYDSGFVPELVIAGAE